MPLLPRRGYTGTLIEVEGSRGLVYMVAVNPAHSDVRERRVLGLTVTRTMPV